MRLSFPEPTSATVGMCHRVRQWSTLIGVLGDGRRVIDLKYSENSVSIELCDETISGRVVVAGERPTMRLSYYRNSQSCCEIMCSIKPSVLEYNITLL